MDDKNKERRSSISAFIFVLFLQSAIRLSYSLATRYSDNNDWLNRYGGGSWEVVKANPVGKWLYFFTFYYRINIVLGIILGVIVLVFVGYNFFKRLEARRMNDPSSSSLPIDSYLVYKPFPELQSKMPGLSETEISELASAVFTDLNNTKDRERLRPFCSEAFYKRLPSVDVNEGLVLSAVPYAWKKLKGGRNQYDYSDSICQLVVKVTVRSAVREALKVKEYDMYFVSTGQEKLRNITNCPHCGGVVDLTKSNKCPYCDVELTKYLAGWLLDDVKLAS